MNTVELPIAPPDRDTAPWWEGTRRRVLLLQRCAGCGHLQHYPRALCTACGGGALAFVPASGWGVIETFTIVHRAPHAAFEPPYPVAMVRLDEGPVLLSAITGGQPGDVCIGARVSVRWCPLPDGRNLPVFAAEGS